MVWVNRLGGMDCLFSDAEAVGFFWDAVRAKHLLQASRVFEVIVIRQIIPMLMCARIGLLHISFLHPQPELYCNAVRRAALCLTSRAAGRGHLSPHSNCCWGEGLLEVLDWACPSFSLDKGAVIPLTKEGAQSAFSSRQFSKHSAIHRAGAGYLHATRHVGKSQL
jgi:hypothetical protein